jgi:hypothetical membrane protein
MATRERRRPRFPDALGIGAVLVTNVGIFVAMQLASWFTLTGFALSNLGQRGVATAPIFNGALVLGGTLGAGFVVGRWPVTDHPIRRAALVVLFPAMVLLALVGVFPLPTALHGVVAIGFFFLMTLGVFLWGAGDYAAGRPARGAVFLVGAVTHLVAWAWWLLLPWLPRGIAIPELVGSTLLSVWAVWIAVDGRA